MVDDHWWNGDQPDGGALTGLGVVSAVSMHDLRLKSKRENGTRKPNMGNAWRY
jgi:hypothetical protein